MARETHSAECYEVVRDEASNALTDKERETLRRALYERIAGANALVDAETEARRMWVAPRYSSWNTHR